MTFGVFIHRADSVYDDSPASQYQFPKPYLQRALATVGDWIVYYEPVKVRGSKGYYAIARVAKIVPDPTVANMYLALIEPGSYLEFPNPVPFDDGNGLVEAGLLNEQGRVSGRAQAAVRPISPKDFDRILTRGLADDQPLLPRIGAVDLPVEMPFQLDEGQAPFAFEQERERVAAMTTRVVRDRVFRRVVLRAYGERCAVTGLKLINGGGRAEVAAAHIRPVEHNGPDIINNGVALSGTAHWMFDRGLIGFNDDLDIIISRQVNDRDGVESLINKTGKMIGPLAARDRPHPAFLNWHRENCFKA
ncbi:HNH endonuclease [Devosia psychrophila]|uniref:Restriction endonuclease n=1 Tax=Devosia psychrophila TaxID=728005 RepID=A0A0F5PS17_9HYPH|nr:HNH endonuclease [Devosia psychrophila]KKC31487.1 restriction endonuclease [Devosia psychrophila]SFB99370.1 putative restriction endonuclease [Devosia psychrophila]